MQSPQLMNRAASSAPALNVNAPGSGTLYANSNISHEHHGNITPDEACLPNTMLHTSSEARYVKPGRLSPASEGTSPTTTQQLPPLAGLLSTVKGPATTRTNSTIERSARIPLGYSPAASSETSTSTSRLIPPDASASNAWSSSATAARLTAARPPLTGTRQALVSPAGKEETPASVQNMRAMQDALKRFNARMLKENEKSRNRGIDTQESSMGTLPAIHGTLSAASESQPTSNPLQDAPSKDNGKPNNSSGTTAETSRCTASLAPRVTIVPQTSPHPPPPSNGSHPAPSTPASSLEEGNTAHTKAAAPSVPNLPDRYAQDSGEIDKKNARAAVGKPGTVPAPSMSPPLEVNPVYSAVEIQGISSASPDSAESRGNVSSDSKRPHAHGSSSGQATVGKATDNATSSFSSAAAPHPVCQPTLPGPCRSQHTDKLGNVGEEVPAQKLNAKPSHNHDASSGGPLGFPSRSDALHDGGPHRLPHASPADEQSGSVHPNDAAARETTATTAAAAKPKTSINSAPTAGQRPPTTSPIKVLQVCNGSSRGGSAPCPDSALNHNGRYSPARVNPSATEASGRDGEEPHRSSVDSGALDMDVEAITLSAYLKEEELNLSMSTFNNIGATLAQSLTLRVLNLKGSTISSEGLRGLADIPTLKLICVSHMRYLTTLVPLVTPTARSNDRPCRIEEIDAQFSPLGNDGIWGLEKLRWLRRLDLGMTLISDVTCLAASHSLHELYLNGTRVDSEGLAGLERVSTLTVLNVARTKVTSLKQIAKSRSIKTLIAYSCHITDDGLLGVDEMPRLSTLDLSTTKVTNLSVLQKSRSLKWLRAQWLSLKNCHDIIQQRRAQMDGVAPDSDVDSCDTEAGFSGLANIPTLESLDMSFNTLRSFHSLCGSKSLKHLILRRTRVDNDGIGNIARLAGTLETLVITNLTDILDESDDEEANSPSNAASGLLSAIGDIFTLRRLTSIDLSFTDVYDLRLLQELRALRELIIVETLVTVDGLRGIEKLAKLETLDISQTSIVSLQFLVGGAPSLKKILARSNRNAHGFHLGRVDQLRALQHLDVSDTVVEDMESLLKAKWRLQTLIWRWKERRDSKGPVPPLQCCVTSPCLVGISTMSCLTTLDLTNSSVQDLSFLERSTSLATLSLRCCRLLRNSAIKSLGTLPALEVLELSDNRHISDVTCLRTCRRLRELRLSHTSVTKAGLKGVTELPELKVLDIANTRAEDDVNDEDVHGALERSRLLEDSNVREGSTLLDSSVAPAQFRVPRRRRVSFVVNDGGEGVSRKSDRDE
ncbi:hypothetical protein, conserved [Leishmania tarentolae]|uniref:Leucine-rich repeat protein n=1 Tax=Leishmania tarentolae TaxID=5689 RepID=A0A640KDW5_LEITA|nr:hypothetical protein, conserved [Leishmania tarentolae]